MNWPLLVALIAFMSPQGGRPPGSPDEATRGGGRASTVQYRGPRRPTDEERERARVRMGITKDQQAQIEALFAETDKQTREAMDKLRELYGQLFAVYDRYDYDRQQLLTVQRQIIHQRRRMLQIHAENEDKLRRILNREQFDRMRALMKEMREQRHRDSRRGPGGGPPGRGPGGPQ